MNLPVLLEPTATGFRASTGSPLNLTTEASTSEGALKAIRLQIAVAFARGCSIVDVGSTVQKFSVASDLLANDPQHDQFLEAMAEYRNERDSH